ncbi:MAG: serine hydrolase [Opitutales bacterium]
MATPCFGTALHEWSFDDRAATSLNHTENHVQGQVNWTQPLANSSATGEGTFRIQRNGSGQNSRFDIGWGVGPGYGYLVVDIAGWDLSHTAGQDPQVRFSFMNGLAADTPGEITAEMRLVANGAGEVTLQARAEGSGGTSSSATTIFPAYQPEPVRLVLAYSDELNQYQVHYRIGPDPWTHFYTGTTSGSREGPSVRMYVIGDFDGGGANFFDLDDVRLTLQSPLNPVPATVLMDTLREESGTIWDLGNGALSIGSGDALTGELRIAGGGQLHSGLAFVGDRDGAAGSLFVEGEGSLWETEDADVVVGNEAGSEGMVEIRSGAVARLGKDGPAPAMGPGRVFVGHRGKGSLNVTDGGSVSAENSLYVGFGEDADGRVEVAGLGSHVDVGTNLRIGANAVLAPAGADALVRVRDEGIVHVGGVVTVRAGGLLVIESNGQLVVEGGLDMGSTGEGGSVELDGGTLLVAGPIDFTGASILTWANSVIVAEDFVTGLNLIASGNTLVLNGPDAFLSHASPFPLNLGSGASIEGTGTVFHAVNLGLHGMGTIRGSDGGRLRMVGEVTGLGTLERVRVNGEVAPASGDPGIELRDVSFADGSTVVIDIPSGANFPRVLFDEETDFSNARLRVRFTGSPPAPGATFEILTKLGGGLAAPFFQGVSLPEGWEMEEGTLFYSGAPRVETYEQWAEAFGLSGDDVSPSADPDADGLSNRAEFFFGADPRVGSGSLFWAGRDGDAAFLRWRQRLAGDSAYLLERSKNLVTWELDNDLSPGPGFPTIKEPAGAGYQWVNVPLPAGTERNFYRVRADDAPALPVYPGETWETIEDPEAEGVPSSTIAECIQLLEGMDTTGFMAIKGGRVLFDHGDLSFVSYSASVRKSILAMLYGRYVESGEIDLFDTLDEIGIDDHLGLLPIEKQATVHDLLRARSGIYHPRSNTGDNWDVAPPRGSQIPGAYYLYNNWDFNALGSIFLLKTGKTPYEALETDFSRRLQMEEFSLAAQKWGGNKSLSMHLAYYYHLSTRDMARLGYLMLRNGAWAGERIIPADWMEQMLFPWTPSQEMNPVSRRSQDFSYGYLWWLRETEEESPYHGSYAGHGAGGQYIMVIPKLDLVLVHKTNSSGTNLSVSRSEFYNLADVLVEGITQ